MAKVWKIVITVVMIALILGAVCVLVGFITGGDTQRVWNLFSATYDLDSVRQSIEQALQQAVKIQPLS